MSKIKEFLYKASGIIIDAAAEATNETIQTKVGEHNQKSAEKKQEKSKVNTKKAD